MSIFNQIPAISEDALCYALYPSQSDKAAVTTLAACILAFASDALPNLIWHRDPFELKVIQSPVSENQWILEGKMRVGDCVDDEWCVVWLLRQVSIRWDVVISVWDSDGDFLLIEAADVLPRWVSPDNAENRVWIYSNRLHLIPLEHVSSGIPNKRISLRHTDEDISEHSSDNDGWLSIEDALSLVRSTSENTVAPLKVEQGAWRRISGYPEMTKHHIHTTMVYLPVDIARALRKNPSLVQKPVESFYTRDSVQLRAAHRMSRFPPSPEVLTSVTLTRTAYAQLIGQRFRPPKIFGQWKEMEGSPEYRWRDIGMKIACGFEMLFQESKTRTDLNVQSAKDFQASVDARKDGLRRHPDYAPFIQNLVLAGYFRGEMQGSQLWNSLEDKAAATFVESRREDDASRPSFAALVSNAIAEDGDTPFIPTTIKEDSDEWLNVDAADFDELMKRAVGQSESSNAMDVDSSVAAAGIENEEDDLAMKQAKRLQSFAAKVEDFVEGEGDLDGAQFDDELSSDEQEEFSDGNMTDSDDESDGDMDQAERQAIMNSLVPGLAPAEYGQMPPSFYEHSQRIAPTTIETDVVETAERPKTGDLKAIPEDEPLPSATPEVPRPIRKPIIPRDRYDGVDSDDDTDEDEQGPLRSEDNEESDEEDEDRPTVIGEIEVDMDAEEAEFLEFSRQALGISDSQWDEILKDRTGRGAFIPASLPPSGSEATVSDDPKSLSVTTNSPPRVPKPGPRPSVNPNLDSFEAVMLAMDTELARNRKSKGKAKADSSSPVKGKSKADGDAAMDMNGDNEDIDIEAAMEAELQALLERGEEDGDEEPAQYGLIKNFLESFKSQAGLSGPVGTLAGRLQEGWTLPRDDS